MLPSFDLGRENVGLADVAALALIVHHADLNLSHVQPTGVLGRVMEFQALEDTVRFRRRDKDHRETGGAGAWRVFSLLVLDREWGVKWLLKLVAVGGEGPCVDIMEISKPDNLDDIAGLG